MTLPWYGLRALTDGDDKSGDAGVYRTVADRSPLPVIMYSSQATGYDIPSDVVVELTEHRNIISIKESAGNLEKVKALVEGTRHIKSQCGGDGNLRGGNGADAREEAEHAVPAGW